MFTLEIDNQEVARYLGVGEGKLDESTAAEIDEATKDLKKKVAYKIEYKVFDIHQEKTGVSIEGTNLKLGGKAISELLQDCQKCILLAVTLGQQVDSYLRMLQVTNLSKAVVTDFCASSMVEQLCNQVDEELRDTWRNQGLYLTDRFSPGYGDLPLEIQKNFCNVLDTQKKMGLYVTSSGLMIPRKSITAIIGIANTQQKMKIKGCKYCDFNKNCEYRKGGRNCG